MDRLPEWDGKPFRLGMFATGTYLNICARCGEQFLGDKRARSCLPCAAAAVEAYCADLRVDRDAAKKGERVTDEYSESLRHLAQVLGMNTLSPQSLARAAADEIVTLRARLTETEKEKRAPVQGYSAGIPWSLHLRAYDVYRKRYGAQEALIKDGCRGGFHADELDEFIPGWREEVDEITSLRARLSAAEEALQFYAHEWKPYCGDHGVPIGTEPTDALKRDEGSRARNIVLANKEVKS